MKRIASLPVLLALSAAPLGSARAASKVAVAALGEPAPGGGVFAGPSFAAWPAAGGDGWIAFRTSLEGASASEALVVARMTPPTTRIQVAAVGQTAPAQGKFKSFIGRPAVNANGDVAFMALLSGDAQTSASGQPTAAGAFLFRQSPPAGQPAVVAVALSGQSVGNGVLDLATPTDAGADTTAVDLPQRALALNDADTVAFVSTILGGPQAAMGIFTATAGGNLGTIATTGEAFSGGVFTAFGQPAINNGGQIAFHGTVDDASVADGIFVYDPATGISERVAAGFRLDGGDTLQEFGDELAFDDAGDVAFTAGPLFDHTRADLVGAPGALVLHAGVVTPVAYPGQQTDQAGRVKGIQLGQAGKFLTAPPALAPDGSVVVFVTLNGGSSEGIFRAAPPYTTLAPLAITDGAASDASPSGGTYNGVEAAPAVDATGAAVFRVQVAGGQTSEAIVYQPVGGAPSGIFVGEGAPSQGFYAGAPFSVPHLNDRGDVVFGAYVAGGPSSVGIFRSRGGALEALARAGDASPEGGEHPFVDFGEPAVNAGGAVAFVGDVANLGRGVFVLDEGGLHQIAVTGDRAPDRPGALFRAFGSGVAINDAGQVAFRGVANTFDPLTNTNASLEGLFLMGGGAEPHMLVSARSPSPLGMPFFEVHDPVITGVPSIAFLAPLGVSTNVIAGFFAADVQGITPLAVEQQSLGDGTVISDLSGKAALDAAGNTVFLATRTRAGIALGPAIVRRAAGGFQVLAARGMVGPAGGTIKSVGAPAMNAAGDVAFRAGFVANTGGTTGFLLWTPSGLAPFVSVGEATPLGGTISSFTARASLAAGDVLAFSADVTRGTTRNAVFLASPASLAAAQLGLALSRRARQDRVSLTVVLHPGRLSDGLDPAHEAVKVTLGDTAGSLWTATVPAGALVPRGPLLVLPRGGHVKGVRLARLRPLAGGALRARVVSARVDLTAKGVRRLVPPFNVTLEVGDDSATAIVPCRVRATGARCAGG
ncbi:MAG TPA: choice-of-anchor tandem repeat NxxGxxAF-containing protein [Candidatus Binatia bacterium]|nr:choice-of-anchor tandem repeat NxxGxxAF-containing protein [Candidatus Binatia bacterium]